jgi:hypothetical protein
MGIFGNSNRQNSDARHTLHQMGALKSGPKLKKCGVCHKNLGGGDKAQYHARCAKLLAQHSDDD